VSTEIAAMVAGLAQDWQDFLLDWDRGLRSGNYPVTTRYNYVLAAVQLARQISARDADSDAAHSPIHVTRQHVEAFQILTLDTWSSGTALNKHKALQQFFKWLSLDEEAINESPMRRIRQPKTTAKLIPIIGDEDTGRLLETCRGTNFIQLRDTAIIRLLYNTGARLSEVAGLTLGDVDLDHDTVVFHGKGAKDRRVRIGPRTARALSRYLRLRRSHHGHERADMWLAVRGGAPLRANGIKIMLRRRGEVAGVDHVHAHRWRHNYAHEWKLAGGDTGDLMLLLGWSSDEMARHYGASAAAERALHSQTRIGIGENV
jgi:integrase/recombinase XerC